MGVGRRKVPNDSECYFFTSGSHLHNSNFGDWKPTSTKLAIMHNKEVVGHRLYFYILVGETREWSMEQYLLKDIDSGTSQIKVIIPQVKLR